jgi:hypothetical protein
MSDYGTPQPPPYGGGGAPGTPMPAYGGGGVPGAPPPPNYLVWAILSAVLCFLPLGIPAIVFSTQVNSRWAMGDVAGAQEASEKARKFAMWSAIAGVIANVLVGVFMLLFFATFATIFTTVNILPTPTTGF